jgi:endonuclease/exonuclease/phosphatase family metal-dependent hydrolase
MKPLRIATLNCLNLALPGRSFYAGVDPYTPDEYIAKTQWLAAMLDRLGADFVLLQEVFHEQALSDVVRQSAGGARLWSLAAPLAGQDNDKPRLAIVWRQPWRPSLESIAGFPQGCAVDIPEAGTQATFSRPLLRAEVQLPEFAGGAALRLFNIHLKSRRPDFVDGEDCADPLAETRAQLRSLIRRGAEAAALRRILEEAAAEGPVALVVAGDFNDDARAATTRMIADVGRRSDGGHGSAFGLFDAFDVEQRPAPHDRLRGAPFTALDDDGPQRIDHVLVSEAFVPGSKRAIGRVVALEVFSDHLFERCRVAHGGTRLERIYSDHAAVCVTLEPVD